MSAATEMVAESKLPPPSKRSRHEPVALAFLEFLSASIALGLLVWTVFLNRSAFLDALPTALPWVLVVAIADLIPVPIWGSVELMISFPVLLAAAFVFPLSVAGFLSVIGTLDVREFRREIPFGRALFNRSNIALSVMAAGWAFQAMGGRRIGWPGVIPVAMVSLLVDFAINSTLVIVGTRLVTGLSVNRLIRNVYGGSQPVPFVAGYACFGLLALLLATVFQAAGDWGLVAFAVPLLLARQMFLGWKSLADARLQLNEEREMLTHVSSRIADERREERLAVAAGIHDEILPPLYKVHLMGQVLRQDLASGRLLDLEADLPDLLQATQSASAALRDLIRDLRKSTLGPGGLIETMQLLAQSLSAQSGVAIHVHAEPVSGSSLTHLLLYQVGREALMNVIRHSGARSCRVSIVGESDGVRLVVEDDGEGFDPTSVDVGSHFGLQLMRERVELAGGVFFLESSPRDGTRVTVRVPVDRSF